nr:RNA-directed DNA polymerase, eukaryota, reverse transcriptase zinc-binding domain protein [Tanacetum cinerariifolium]
RDILYSGLSLDCKVANVIKNGVWDWPFDLVCKFNGLSVIQPPCLIEGKSDKVVWRNIQGRIKDFSVYEVWNDIRSRNVLVPWSRLRDDDLCCVFCKEGPDSHNHLFFECGFPKEVWCRPINKSIWSILQRLLLGATVYTVWQERNLKIFQNRSRSMDMVCNFVKGVVRLRVLSLGLNPSIQVYEAADLWNFHVCKEIGSRRLKISDRRNHT